MDENPPSAQSIGFVQGNTNEGNVTFSITQQNPSGAFAIDPVSGELKVADASLFKFDINPVITGNVKVSNGDIFENSSVTINLNEVIYVDKYYQGDLSLRTQQAINAFGTENYTHITGTLLIGYDYHYMSDIYDLSPLHSLKNVNSLYISQNPDLISTSGLAISNIERSLYILENASLKTLEGFDAII